MRLPLWSTGPGRLEDAMSNALTRSVALLVTIALLFFAGVTPAWAAVPDNQQQLTNFDPPINVTSGTGVSVSTNPSTGKTLIAFIQPDATTTNGGMLVVGLLNASGALDGSLVEVSTTISSAGPDQYQPPYLAAGLDGSWLVVWPFANATNGIAGQIISASGTLSGANFYVSDDLYSNIETVAAAWSATDARYLVTWKARVNERTVSLGALNDQQIVGQFVNGTGSLIGSNFLISNLLDGVNDSQGVAFGNGIWIAVFSENGEFPTGQLVTAAGLLGTAFRLSSDESQSYYAPRVVYNSVTQQFLVSFWEDDGEDSKHLRLLTGDGSPLGSDTVYVAGGARPVFGVSGASGYVMTWHISGKVWAQAFDATLNLVGERYQVSNDALNAFRPEISCTDGGFMFAYWGAAGGVSNIYSNLVAGDCGFALPATNRAGSIWTTTLAILAGLTAAAGIGLRMRGATRT